MTRHHLWLTLASGLLFGIGTQGTIQAQLAPPAGQNPNGNNTPWVLRPQGTTAQPPAPARTQSPEPSRPGPEAILAQAIATHPATAMYPVSTTVEGGRVVFRGVVGTKLAYDAVINMAIASGLPFRDHLVIDTAAAHVAAEAAMAFGPAGGPAFAGAPLIASATGPVPYPPTYGQFSPQPGVIPPYVYPQPLFGRLDEPFYGFEPPLISYPPWWGAMSARRLGEMARDEAAAEAARSAGDFGMPGARIPGVAGDGVGLPGDGRIGVGVPGEGGISFDNPSTNPTTNSVLPDTIELTIDGRGVATLRGTVPTLSDRIAIGQYLAREPGISQVINLLDVVPADSPVPSVPEGNGNIVRPPPPPPPDPGPVPARPPALIPPNEQEGPDQDPNPDPDPDQAAKPVESGVPATGDRLAEALALRPELEGLTIQATLQNGVATLSGEVPTALEAMLAYLAVEQVEGVEEIIDRLRFTVPDGQGQNPLLGTETPEKVEAYLLAQLRRQLGDQARVDRVRILGHRLEVLGALPRSEDRARVEAVLRSIPLLRGFELAPRLVTVD
ncbi:hypothetical protein BH23PLA1_BH23PLA1_23880 [soil metagenome]